MNVTDLMRTIYNSLPSSEASCATFRAPRNGAPADTDHLGLAQVVSAPPSGLAPQLPNNATIDANGLLNITNGSFSANTTTNNGRVELDGSASLLGGGTIVNNAFIEGTGRISAMLNNTTNGQVNAVNGEKISFFGSGNTNDGTIGVINATVEFTQNLTNNASGSITVRDAILRFGGGVINDGSIGLSFGNSDIYGDITNNSDGAVVVTGASSATFQGNVVNNGDVRVSTGSTAVFFGDVGRPRKGFSDGPGIYR